MEREPDHPSPALALTAIGAVVLCCTGPLVVPLLAGVGALLMPLLPVAAVALAPIAAGLVLWRRRRCRQQAGEPASRATDRRAHPG